MESHFPVPASHQSALARQRVMDDLSTLIRDAELLLRATAGDLGEKTREARLRVIEGIERAKASAAALKRRGVATVKQADVVVRNRPYESIATAVAVGAIVGFFLAHHLSSQD